MFTINYSGIINDITKAKDGLSLREIEYFKDQFANLHSEFIMEKQQFGFCQILHDEGFVKKARDFYKKNGTFDTVVVLGIGGSALGAKAILNIIPPDDLPRTFHVLDNIDPFTLKNTFAKLNLKTTIFFVISKSGETVETLSQFLYCYDAVKKAKLDPSKHFVLITDPEKGFLRTISKKEKFTAFEVPPNVGGRFSVLSNVGILPAYYTGIDAQELIAGARHIDKKCAKQVFLMSLFLYLLNTRRDKRNVVMMPYCDRLYEFSLWFSQLWAESLGKKHGLNGEVLNTGHTPIVARGVTDQHSQLQLYLEGIRDKAVILLKSKEQVKLTIPKVLSEYPSVNYLNKKTFDQLFDAEYIGTYGALIQAGIPVIRIEVDELNAKTLGGLFQFFELCTAFSGKLYSINPFDQPGVEAGKKIAFAHLGKDGFKGQDFKHSLKNMTHELSCD